MTAAEFKAGREKLGLTQAALASVFLISDGRTIRRWESGEWASRGRPKC